MIPGAMKLSLVISILVMSRLFAGEPRLAGVGEAMQTQVVGNEIAGAVTLVTTPERTIHWEATGFSHLEKRTPMERDAVFLLASISKVFTSIAILMLQDEGKLKVTDPVAKYLPEFRGLKTKAGEPTEPTIAHLLSHFSGLEEIDRTSAAAVKDLAGLLDVHTPIDPPSAVAGTQWRYNTFAFEVAGRIVEVVSGRPFDAFLDERLLAPLGMRETTFYPDPARLAGLYAKSRRTGLLERREDWDGLPVPLRGKFPPLPGSGLFSTAEDLGKFCRMLLNGGELGGRRYLSAEAFRLLSTIQTGAEPQGYRGWGLGACVTRNQDGGGIARWLSVGSFGHGGASGCHLMIDPKRRVGYVLLLHRTNLPGGSDHAVVRRFLEVASEAVDRPR